MFDGLGSLATLDLRGNALGPLDSGVLDSLAPLEDLRLPTPPLSPTATPTPAPQADDGDGLGTAVWVVIAVAGGLALAAGGWLAFRRRGRRRLG